MLETTDKTIVAVQLHEVYSDVSICVIGKTYVLHSIGLRNQTVTITYAYYYITYLTNHSS